MGGPARRLDARPRCQDAAQEEDNVQEEDVRPSESGRRREDLREQEEEEVDHR